MVVFKQIDLGKLEVIACFFDVLRVLSVEDRALLDIRAPLLIF